MTPVLQIAYDLKHQLDTNTDKNHTYVDGVDTGMSAYERICCIINFIEQDVAEQAGKEAYGYLIVED